MAVARQARRLSGAGLAREHQGPCAQRRVDTRSRNPGRAGIPPLAAFGPQELNTTRAEGSRRLAPAAIAIQPQAQGMTASGKSKLIKGTSGDWEVVIGMEIHAQVTSKSKLCSGASTEFGGEPN